jgi:hypothetical protein
MTEVIPVLARSKGGGAADGKFEKEILSEMSV